MTIREDHNADPYNVIMAMWNPQNHPANNDEISTWNENTSAPALAKTLEKPMPMNQARPTPNNEPKAHPIAAAIDPSIIAV